MPIKVWNSTHQKTHLNSTGKMNLVTNINDMKAPGYAKQQQVNCKNGDVISGAKVRIINLTGSGRITIMER